MTADNPTPNDGRPFIMDKVPISNIALQEELNATDDPEKLREILDRAFRSHDDNVRVRSVTVDADGTLNATVYLEDEAKGVQPAIPAELWAALDYPIVIKEIQQPGQLNFEIRLQHPAGEIWLCNVMRDSTSEIAGEEFQRAVANKLLLLWNAGHAAVCENRNDLITAGEWELPIPLRSATYVAKLQAATARLEQQPQVKSDTVVEIGMKDTNAMATPARTVKVHPPDYVRIEISGLMGAGKTAVGRLIVDALRGGVRDVVAPDDMQTRMPVQLQEELQKILRRKTVVILERCVNRPGTGAPDVFVPTPRPPVLATFELNADGQDSGILHYYCSKQCQRQDRARIHDDIREGVVEDPAGCDLHCDGCRKVIEATQEYADIHLADDPIRDDDTWADIYSRAVDLEQRVLHDAEPALQLFLELHEKNPMMAAIVLQVLQAPDSDDGPRAQNRREQLVAEIYAKIAVTRVATAYGPDDADVIKRQRAGQDALTLLASIRDTDFQANGIVRASIREVLSRVDAAKQSGGQT